MRSSACAASRVEGQAIELGWIRKGIVPTRDIDYINMVSKKTSWYTCRSPSVWERSPPAIRGRMSSTCSVTFSWKSVSRFRYRTTC